MSLTSQFVVLGGTGIVSSLLMRFVGVAPVLSLAAALIGLVALCYAYRRATEADKPERE